MHLLISTMWQLKRSLTSLSFSPAALGKYNLPMILSGNALADLNNVTTDKTRV
jgi:hypothetical protein